MQAKHEVVLCRYRYDALDRLVESGPFHQSPIQCFFQRHHLATQIQGQVQRSIFQNEDQQLAQQRRQGAEIETALLATDQQRSVLHTINSSPVGYTAYGYRPSSSAVFSVLGFNGEPWDPVTGRYLLGNGYRAFNPVLMRFNSPDSWSPFGEGGLNTYGYCLGDPINRRDPTGHSVLKLWMMFRERTASPLGSLRLFTGTPHVLDTIAGNLSGRDLWNFSRASTVTQSIAQKFIEPLGDLTPLKGKPLQTVAGFLAGDDLVNFSLASKEMQKTARGIQQPPLWPDRDTGHLSVRDLQMLRRTALGEMPGHFPSEVLQDKHLLGVSRMQFHGNNPQLEALRYEEKLIRKRMKYEESFNQRERIRQGL
ncbi:RHS repeat-associated core domain-containing protein [Pseudomonas sp. Sample_16]|uniref:RHS repeat-associated core domain-containing protein n=1 Tax=Pseudomonas sp. Sample_16 TaxID=2448263 RepID=UPI001032CEC5|nr:RHS repeat-associated core domain-containing protein [Pseudomonas sp. Sample_16]